LPQLSISPLELVAIWRTGGELCCLPTFIGTSSPFRNQTAASRHGCRRVLGRVYKWHWWRFYELGANFVACQHLSQPAAVGAEGFLVVSINGTGGNLTNWWRTLLPADIYRHQFAV
jgi:hypothetical protein